MSETATEVQMDRISRMDKLTETTPDVYRYAFAWLAGAGSVDSELAERIDKAIDFVERTFSQ